LQVLPPKADIEVVKLGGGSRTVLYFVEAQPLFFGPSGRDDWVPTGAHSPFAAQLFPESSVSSAQWTRC
jgi:hypothetical protein